MNPDLSKPGPIVIAEVLDRAASADYEEWWAKVTDSGFCAAPVRLVGGSSLRQTEILARCKNRRASVCPSCSQLYAGDTWQLVHAGIVGEDGASVLRGHPMVFVTLTAPSFGAVHSAASNATSESPHPCRPGRKDHSCRHGRPSGCAVVHRSGDAILGEPLCPDCYDYIAHVLSTWHAPELWHRFTIALRRLVARRCRTNGDDPSGVRVAYVKVVEMQRRAVPHFHTVIRLDTSADHHGALARAQIGIDAVELGALARQAGSQVTLGVRSKQRLATLRFGEQLDVRPLDELSGRRVAAYLAKYVTKSVGDLGLGARRLHEGVIDELDVSEHIRRILQTVAELAREPEHRQLGAWLHTLGYRGHITTKTRRYSTTMGELRARREAWRQSQGRADEQTDASDKTVSEAAGLVPAEWRYISCGHATDGERFLAVSAAGRAREMRRIAREELDDQLGRLRPAEGCDD